ncbi:MAG: flagellar protein FliT [Burkholderiales bacterium]
METQYTMLMYYESVEEVLQSMLHAAQNSEWDRLVEAEQYCSRLVACLRAIGDRHEPLDATGQRRKSEIIRRVLATDAQIRDLAQPRLRELEILMRGSRTSRQLKRAYQN